MLHFAFLDGAIGYDCVACGARCCKGLGFAFAGTELMTLLGRAPAQAPFWQLSREAVRAFDLADGCWALADDGRCGIELAHGRAAKPSTCRLFPVNRLWRAGATTIVELQLAQCPLVNTRELPSRAGASVIRWDEAAREIADAGSGAVATEARLPAGLPDDWLAREAAVRDATRPLVDGAVSALEVLVGTGADGARLAALGQAWRRFFAIADQEATAHEARLARPFALALPSLRLQLLTAVAAPPWPRLARARDAQLAAGAFIAALSARAGRPPTLRAVAELWRALPLLRELLARWHEPVALADAAAPSGAPAELAAAWSALLDAAATRPIGEALASTTLSPPLRPLLLRLASDRMR